MLIDCPRANPDGSGFAPRRPPCIPVSARQVALQQVRPSSARGVIVATRGTNATQLSRWLKGEALAWYHERTGVECREVVHERRWREDAGGVAAAGPRQVWGSARRADATTALRRGEIGCVHGYSCLH